MATSATSPPAELPRRLGLWPATALNMIDMVGIGPFVVLPLVVQTTNGAGFLWAWVLGAAVSAVDALIWAQLGAAFPRAGGSYNFLNIAYGPRWGRLMGFLYVWQTLIQAPLVVASGAIGFAQYASYLMPMDEWTRKAVSGGLVLVVVTLLYRRIDSIGRLGVVLWGIVLFTLGGIILSGFTKATQPFGATLQTALATPTNGWLNAGLGAATVKTIYCYLGYYNVCHLGGEIQRPERNIPRSMFLSVAGIATLYLLLNLSVASALPLPDVARSSFIVSTFMESLYGPRVASVATVLVLMVALSSLFAVLLGYSRVPYAAAADGQFFPAFARLHPTRQFPYVSLLVLGGLAFGFSLLFRLGDVITAILAMRIVVQFIGQAVGLLVLHRRVKAATAPTYRFPFKMPLYPLPVWLAIGVWAFIFYATGATFMLSGLAVIGLGVVAFGAWSYWQKQWPFAPTTSERSV